MRKTEIENLIKENIKDTALRIYELDNDDRKSWFFNDICVLKSVFLLIYWYSKKYM